MEEKVVIMGVGTRFIAIIALFFCILFADAMLDSPVAMAIVAASFIYLMFLSIFKGGEQ